MRHLLEHIGPGLESWWNSLGKPDLTPANIDRLVELFEASNPLPLPELVRERDALLIALIETIRTTRERLADGAGEPTP
jgi:hypothetical protein